MLFIDSVFLVSILLASFSILLGYWYFPKNDLVWVIFGSPIIAIPIFVRFGLYRAIIRYIGFKALWTIVKAVSLYTLVWGTIVFMVEVDGIPHSVILINWIISLLIIGGLRVIARWLLTRDDLGIGGTGSYGNCKRVMVYGAGDAGIQLISALEYSKEYNPIGLIDDSEELQGNQIRGLNIYSSDNIDDVINKLKVDEVLIAMPSASRTRRLSIIDKLESYPILVRMLPGVAELAEGKVSIRDLREVSIKDLLGRDPVPANKELLDLNIKDKVVMVTGAGGSIGSELCRQILYLKPKVLLLFELSELALYTIDRELSDISMPNIEILPILGSVNNKKRLSIIFSRFGVQTVYHAAAYKHVPMVEFNSTEGVSNNVFGTLCCAQAAIDEGVETFVLISTDKAVRPTNTMGATKRFSEMILQALSDKQSGTIFSMVRFGNVLGSSGSVIPLFKKQIKFGGPVTVTNAEIIRYFMTIPEAVELVIQASAMGKGGDVFVLNMGEPIFIEDLAKKMIRLSGLKVKDDINSDGDIEIKYTGLRPGEKLYEELLIGDNAIETDNSMIMCAQEEMLAWDELRLILDDLEMAITNCDQKKLRELLMKAVPGFKPQCEIIDVLYDD
jgi:FlaA1/EpsC-like NDP-sugar epimerase